MLVLSDISAMTTQQTLVLSLAIILLTITVMNIRRRRPKDGSPKQYRREIDAATSQSAAIKRDMEALLIELEELSRKINAQIDTKFAKLEQSIADADRRVAALRILIDEAKRLQGEPPAEAGTPVTETPPSVQAAPAVPENQGADDTRAPETRSEAAIPPTNDRRQRIYEMADAGRSAIEIAREIGTQPGEVELILNLRLDTGR